MAHMNTTPHAEETEGPTSEAPSNVGSDNVALEALAALDPADAPEPAERLAADLASALEGVGAEPQPEQLAAPFGSDDGASP